MSNNETLTDFFGEPISIYTRAQAIADGVLVDVSDRAKRYAIRFPVALTDGLHSVLTERAYGSTEAVVRRPSADHDAPEDHHGIGNRSNRFRRQAASPSGNRRVRLMHTRRLA